MIPHPLQRLSLLAVLAVASAALVAAEPPRDPFAGPDLDAPERADAAPTPEPEPVVELPRLRGVLLAGPDSLVNIDGEVLALGEEIRGYRLVEVGERSAVLAREGVRVVIRFPDEGDE